MSEKITYPAGPLIKHLILTVTGFILLNSYVNAQNSTSLIEGYVFDEDTEIGIGGANVYLSETTWFTKSDTEGYFSLPDITPGRYQLVISHNSFEPYKREVQLKADAEIFFEQILNPLQNEQATVNESERNREWRRNFRRFEELFIGKSENGKRTEIVNPEVLIFKSDRNTFSVKAVRQLHLRNSSLGYKIVMDLTHFEWNEESGSGRIHYFCFFNELDPHNHEVLDIWRTNREKTYSYSPDHFFKSLINDNLQESGYKITDGEIDAVSANHNDEYRIFNELNRVNTFKISFEHPKTRLTVEMADEKIGYIGFNETGEEQTFEFYIDRNGRLLNPMDLFLDGIWEHYKIADKLPLNYLYE